ncbi:MAG: ATP-dependent helicase [Anaerolineae bacterium]|nr:ATP-dependent helicase [Thermoflexales bacterium]MDW8407437.1 ATP-dependent helicase [Anaerolineae bacterium]
MKLRPQQAEIAGYRGGLLAVSAAPGSGKTHTLAALAAQLIREGVVPPDSEVLVVTFTHSAVEAIRSRIRRALAEQHLPAEGFRVLTLHSLAHQIVRERPDLAGVPTDFRIDDELSSRQAMLTAVRDFVRAEEDYWRSFLPPELAGAQRAEVEERWRETTQRIGAEVTRLAKNLRWTPAELRMRIAGNWVAAAEAGDEAPPVSPFLRIGAAIYERYERILSAGGRLDFDDLIWRAIIALNNDDDYRRRLARRWQFILEDEAQDSTPLQEEILESLVREHGNWVRVGDPNQAIMTTFTASDVRLFRDRFPRRLGVRGISLSQSGRSAQPIIDLANRLVDWATHHHPEPEVRQMALSKAARIAPVAPDDTQPNPPATESMIHAHAFDTGETEAQRIAQSAVSYILRYPDRTCGVLAPTNAFGRLIARALEEIQSRYPGRTLFEDQLRNTLRIRVVAGVLGQALRFCGQPANTAALVGLRRALQELAALDRRADQDNEETDEPPARRVEEARPAYDDGLNERRINTLLRSAKVERLLFPDPLDEPALPARVPVGADEQRAIDQLASLAAKWARASTLSPDQIALVVAHDVLRRTEDLAAAHSMALSLRRYAEANPNAQLGELADQLDDIAANRQKYLSDSLLGETSFQPTAGVITVTTMHKAKGLEWDRVYLTSVDQIEFPHQVEGAFRGEQWYLEGRDPATEARMQLRALYERSADGAAHRTPLPTERDLIRQARLEYIAERLRLLYVGVTRARRDLILTWSRERGGQPNRPALAIEALVLEGPHSH